MPCADTEVGLPGELNKVQAAHNSPFPVTEEIQYFKVK